MQDENICNYTGMFITSFLFIPQQRYLLQFANRRHYRKFPLLQLHQPASHCIQEHWNVTGSHENTLHFTPAEEVNTSGNPRNPLIDPKI